MFFKEHHTLPSLSPYIRSFWTFEAEALPGSHSGHGQRFLSEGLEFTFNLADPIDIGNCDGAVKTVAGSGITGPMIRPMRLRPTGAVNLFGICFRPGGSYPFFKIPAHELLDQSPDVGDLWGSEGCNFVERIQNDCLSTQSRIEAVSVYLLRLLEQGAFNGGASSGQPDPGPHGRQSRSTDIYGAGYGRRLPEPARDDQSLLCSSSAGQ